MKSYVVVLLVVVAVLGGFYGGYKVGHNTVSASTTPQNTIARNPNAGGGGFPGTRGGGLAAACPSPGATPSSGAQALARGTISNLTSSTLTVTNPTCDVKVTLGTNITITKQTTGTTADLKNNLTVTITGTRQPDGSIVAQTIQIAGGQAGS